MSDFDKEAEREKLREKFERDRQKREQSERMSELLLKGATMTNKHHDCGSPIFRWEGEEFCPSCGGPNGAGGTDTEAPGTGSGGGPAESVEATGEATPDQVDGAVDAASDAAEIDVTTEPAEEGGEATDPTPARSGGTTRSRPESGTAGGPERGGGPAAGEGVAAARASLERTLAAVAREAEETPTTDLSRKRNLVAAARETAEALEATRRAGRQ
ncbi:hypothetical protein BRC93_02180 [Halobacteriales archaeon QS_5_70_15]|nr:MAG: hypothetical protein BRC93_02180 [Halobacteriales archaeon QS_5_70_15]